MSEPEHPYIEPFAVALQSCCPRCGKGKLYAGLLKLHEECDYCGLDLRASDAGDGPAFFVITVMGFLITFTAGFVEFVYQPPYWLHAALWLPAILILCPIMLRFFKSYLIAMQYKVKLLKEEVD